MSDNEWQAAGQYREEYEIQFWGGVRIEERAEFGYVRLIEAGYPIVILNPSHALTVSPWTIKPLNWRVRYE